MSRKKINLVKYILADPRHDSAYSSCTFIDFIHKIPLSKLKRDFVLLHHDNIWIFNSSCGGFQNDKNKWRKFLKTFLILYVLGIVRYCVLQNVNKYFVPVPGI